MNLVEKVHAIEGVFQRLEEAVSSFQGWSSLHCKQGCSRCCVKSDLEATPLEFLPLAHYLFEQNLAHEWVDKLTASEQITCHVLNERQAGMGLCSMYAHRGLICRLFGYSARVNKHGLRELVTCQVIKTEQQPAFEQASKQFNEDKDVPVISHYYMQLHAIDAEMARDFYPINRAIRKAIETVLHYYAYRN